MLNYYKKALPLTVGTFFSILCIITLIEFVRGLDVYDLEYTLEVLHYLVISIIAGFIGIPMFFMGLEKVVNNNG